MKMSLKYKIQTSRLWIHHILKKFNKKAVSPDYFTGYLISLEQSEICRLEKQLQKQFDKERDLMSRKKEEYEKVSAQISNLSKLKKEIEAKIVILTNLHKEL